MKKQLLFAGLLFGSVFSVNAQVLQTESFNGMTVGNVSADITGATTCLLYTSSPIGCVSFYQKDTFRLFFMINIR